MSWRQIGLLAICLPLALLGCGRAAIPTTATRHESIETRLANAASFLMYAQSDDGGWRSTVYSTFSQGDALTPLVVCSLQEMKAPGSEAALERGLDYLAALVDENEARGKRDLAYPVYTAACAVVALSRAADRDDYRAARDAWLRDLLSRQLDEALGWQPDDAWYGGWGYGGDRPRRPAAGESVATLAEPNLSATVFALTALRAAGMPADHAAFARAARFVARLQNYAEFAEKADPRFDDGGFYFIQDDAVRNKAGAVGKNSQRSARFASYGSATADGLRALLLCGLPASHPRVLAAGDWLAARASADGHPGDYAPDRQHAREAVFFYYGHSLSLILASEPSVYSDALRSQMATSLAEALAARQQADGHWQNDAVDVREDDPLVATSLAAMALAHCHQVMTRN